jgi:dTDP-4-dehydrorhamnose 3,5-epimerase
MSVAATEIDGLAIVTLKQIDDERGSVREFFRVSAYGGWPFVGVGEWRQINVTESRFGSVRGLHGENMVKLVSCVSGEAFGAYLDARAESPTYGVVVTVHLRPGTQILVPPGVCNAFQALSPEGTQYVYCFTEEWSPTMGGFGFTPLDEDLGISWPIPIDANDRSQVSAKDATAPRFRKS